MRDTPTASRAPAVRCLVVLAAAWLGASTPAQAQPVWRCGNAYQQQPCPGGEPVAAGDARSAADRERNDAEVARQQRAANAMEQTRLQAERQASRAPVLPVAPQDTVEPPNGGEVFTARVPKPVKAKAAKKVAKAAKAAKPARKAASTAA